MSEKLTAIERRVVIAAVRRAIFVMPRKYRRRIPALQRALGKLEKD